MIWSKWTRQFHRWTSMAFTAGVIVNVFALAGGVEPPFWVYLLALIPLFLLLATGLYLFVLPYTAAWRSGRGGGGYAARLALKGSGLSSANHRRLHNSPTD